MNIGLNKQAIDYYPETVQRIKHTNLYIRIWESLHLAGPQMNN